MPFLREREGGLVIQVVLRPPSKSSRPSINFILVEATLVTVLLAGFLNDYARAWTAVFGDRGHEIASFIGLAVTFLTGFAFFGLLNFLHAPSPQPNRHFGLCILDPEVQKGPRGISYIILGLCAVVLPPSI